MRRRIGKVLLVFPPVVLYEIEKHDYVICMAPLGLGYLAAAIRDRYGVEVLDALAEGYNIRTVTEDSRFASYGLTAAQIRQRIEAAQPDVVGVSVLYSLQMRGAIETGRIAKQVNPDVITICGGTHPSFKPEDALGSKAFDFVVCGEGEQTLPDLLDRLENGADPLECLGIAAMKDGKILVTGSHPLIADLDAIVFPARDLLPMDLYFKVNMPWFGRYLGGPRSRRNTLFITSRGCPHRCPYCSSTRHWGYRYRARSIENVIEEMIQIQSKHGIQELQFSDDALLINRKRALRLFRTMIEARVGMHWCVPNGLAVNDLDEPLLDLMAQAGCYEITMSVESGSPRVQHELLHKSVKLERVPGLVRRAKSLGMKVLAFFIIGFPGETLDDMRRTIDFALESEFDFPILFAATPLPGSEMYNEYVRMGAISPQFDLSFNDYFVYRLNTTEFSAQDVNNLMQEFYRRSFLRVFRHNPLFYARLITHNLVSSPIAFARRNLNRIAHAKYRDYT